MLGRWCATQFCTLYVKDTTPKMAILFCCAKLFQLPSLLALWLLPLPRPETWIRKSWKLSSVPFSWWVQLFPPSLFGTLGSRPYVLFVPPPPSTTVSVSFLLMKEFCQLEFEDCCEMGNALFWIIVDERASLSMYKQFSLKMLLEIFCTNLYATKKFSANLCATF